MKGKWGSSLFSEESVCTIPIPVGVGERRGVFCALRLVGRSNRRLGVNFRCDGGADKGKI